MCGRLWREDIIHSLCSQSSKQARILRVNLMLHMDQNMLCCLLGHLSAVPGWAYHAQAVSCEAIPIARLHGRNRAEVPSLFCTPYRPVRELRGDRHAGHEPARPRLKEVRKLPWTRVPGSRPAEASRGRARRLSLLEESRVRGVSVQYGAARSSARPCSFTKRSGIALLDTGFGPAPTATTRGLIPWPGRG